jgi:hypothetical protein
MGTSITMSDLFLGWDVGAWNCDRNRESRDALCTVELGESGPVVVGKPWRGNVRDLLVTYEGSALIEALLLRLDLVGRRRRLIRCARRRGVGERRERGVIPNFQP